MKNQHQYTEGSTTYRHQGRKWHFTSTGPNGCQFTAIMEFRGGHTFAQRIARLFDKDVPKLGKLGNLTRANIDRMILAHA